MRAEAVVEGIEVDVLQVVAAGIGQGGEAEAVGDVLGAAEQVRIGRSERIAPVLPRGGGLSSGETLSDLPGQVSI